MNRKKYIALTLILSLLSINRVYADCTQEELDVFKQVEDQYKVTYELNKSTKDYTVILHKVSSDKYYYLLEEKFNTNGDIISNDTQTTYKGIKPGEYTIRVRSKNNNCKDDLKTINIKLSKYNKYSEDPLCIGIEEFYLCQDTYDKEIDRETFESRVNTYKKTKENEQEENNEINEEQNEIDKYINYIKENLFQVIIIVVFIILVIITAIVTINQSRKSRRLE